MRNGLAASGFVLISAMALGGAWHHWRWNLVVENELARFASETPQPACVEVVLADRVKVSPPADDSPLRAIPAGTVSEATVHVVAIRDGARWRPAAGWSRLRVAGQWRGVPGDRLRVYAQLARPAPAMNPGSIRLGRPRAPRGPAHGVVLRPLAVR
jgi:hypothetical protein